ncbi:HAMP domain-containing histidine kinase [Pyxidicoccus parkwayensis]|uniref:histidine kinase n=1 Tax=Pyxidicoccus parkwayensis TaxID=2813578 RepID=A0ABX7P4U7_9BACT|nr:HAMP domain-containing sensor histidine kinase [Pyxidicoccus parkwaysis]QSQ25422.1 HAMP domain-containing histidine kinase [Pyxidicoccus parkwaysis]
MDSLGELLCDHTDELVQRWYERWLRERPSNPRLTEAALKDHLPLQLRVIGGALLKENSSRESPRELWRQHGRLAPEQRVLDEVLIEEVVREYGFVIEEVRIWLGGRGEQVSVQDYSFFSLAIFELTAESVRRYAKFRAEQVARERSEYVASIAHQLRTPVSTLNLSLQQLERGHGTPDARTLERLRRTVARLGRLVDGILRLERFKPEELPIHPESLAPAQIIDQIVADYEHDASSKGLRLDVSANRSARMQVDRDLLVDALGNLIQNAIKYTAKGFVRVTLEEQEDAVVFKVEDSGPGISSDRQRELFRPVYPGQPGGVGLGLSIAFRAAVAQGGALELESEPGRGSTFLLRLPWLVCAREEPTDSRADSGFLQPAEA